MPFVPIFAAAFPDALIEQVMAIVQANQADAIAAFGNTQFSGVNGYLLEEIVDFHKGPIAAPGNPCMTVTASTPAFNYDGSPDLLDYHTTLTCWLDLVYMDPEQLADWTLKYTRLLHQIFSTVSSAGQDLTPFTTPMMVEFPTGSEPRLTVPPAVGAVKALEMAWDQPGVLAADEDSKVPSKIRIPFHLTFHMMEV